MLEKVRLKWEWVSELEGLWFTEDNKQLVVLRAHKLRDMTGYMLYINPETYEQLEKRPDQVRQVFPRSSPIMRVVIAGSRTVRLTMDTMVIRMVVSPIDAYTV